MILKNIKIEFSTLEVFIYEELKCNLYVHHEITLSAFPLCLEWLPIEFSSYNEIQLQKVLIFIDIFLNYYIFN